MALRVAHEIQGLEVSHRTLQVECGEALKSWMSTGGPDFMRFLPVECWEPAFSRTKRVRMACPESNPHNMSDTHAK